MPACGGTCRSSAISRLTPVISVLLAGGVLTAFYFFGIAGVLQDKLSFIPWVGPPELLDVLIVVAALGPALTVLPTLVLTSKYLKV